MNCHVRIRVTGIFVENGDLLVVKQAMDSGRDWSLPGEKVEAGETLQQALIREMEEETGLLVDIAKLLYICDLPETNLSVLHITFLVDRLEGSLRLPSNEYDDNPISDVRMVPIHELTDYGFTDTFRGLALRGFPGAGSYKGPKSAIGL